MSIKYAILKTSDLKSTLKRTVHFSSTTEYLRFPILLEPKGKAMPFSISLNNQLYDVYQSVFFSDPIPKYFPEFND